MGERGPENILTGIDAEIRDLEFTALECVPGYQAGYSLWGPGVDLASGQRSNEMHAAQYSTIHGIDGPVFVYGHTVGNAALNAWKIYIRTMDGRTARVHKESNIAAKDRKTPEPLRVVWDNFDAEFQMRAGLQQMTRAIIANPAGFRFMPGVAPQTAK